MKESVSTSSDSCMDTKGFAMGSNQSLMLLCTRLFFSREWKIIWFIGWMTELKTTKIFAVKSKSIQMLSSYQIQIQIDIVLLLKALFFWSVLMQYMLFSSVTGDALICDVRKLLKECPCLWLQKRLPFGDCGITKTHIFFTRWNFTFIRPFWQWRHFNT